MTPESRLSTEPVVCLMDVRLGKGGEWILPATLIAHLARPGQTVEIRQVGDALVIERKNSEVGAGRRGKVRPVAGAGNGRAVRLRRVE